MGSWDQSVSLHFGVVQGTGAKLSYYAALLVRGSITEPIPDKMQLYTAHLGMPIRGQAVQNCCPPCAVRRSPP